MIIEDKLRKKWRSEQKKERPKSLHQTKQTPSVSSLIVAGFWSFLLLLRPVRRRGKNLAYNISIKRKSWPIKSTACIENKNK